MSSTLQPVDRSRETLVSEITRKLLEYLLSGDVHPGDRLPSERNLSETLGVGRSVVREALKSLTVLGLIEVRQGDGTYLKRTDSELLPQAIEWGLLLGAKRITDLIEARHFLEVLLAGLAAERRDEPSLARLRQWAEVMENTKDPEEFVAADIAFHLEVAAAAQNDSLSQIMKSIRALLQVWISRVVHASPASGGPTWGEHAAVLAAIEQRDSDAARAAMESHMDRATRRLEQTFQEHGTVAAEEAPERDSS